MTEPYKAGDPQRRSLPGPRRLIVTESLAGREIKRRVPGRMAPAGSLAHHSHDGRPVGWRATTIGRLANVSDAPGAVIRGRPPPD
jgi:hypothetical protein